MYKLLFFRREFRILLHISEEKTLLLRVVATNVIIRHDCYIRTLEWKEGESTKLHFQGQSLFQHLSSPFCFSRRLRPYSLYSFQIE